MTRKILLIEDDENLLELYRLALNRGGFQVEPAHNAMLGIIALDRDTFDVVVTDIHMPDSSGLDVIQHLQNDPRHAHTQIIAITADQNRLPEVRRLGVQHIMVKPFTIVEISKKVSSLLE
ncbi:MAG: response regulator [Anaerolineales bacterium]